MTLCLITLLCLFMSLAIQINKKLDEMLAISAEIKRMHKDLDEGVQLKNLETGKPTTKKEALKIVESMINEIKNDLNKMTNNGKRVKDLFTNQYYVNDFSQDKAIANGSIK